MCVFHLAYCSITQLSIFSEVVENSDIFAFRKIFKTGKIPFRFLKGYFERLFVRKLSKLLVEQVNYPQKTMPKIPLLSQAMNIFSCLAFLFAKEINFFMPGKNRKYSFLIKS